MSETLEDFVKRRAATRKPGDKMLAELSELVKAVQLDPSSPSAVQLARQYAAQRRRKDTAHTNVHLSAETNRQLARMQGDGTKRAIVTQAVELLDVVRGQQCREDVAYILHEWGAVDEAGAVSLAIRAFAKFSREKTIDTIDL